MSKLTSILSGFCIIVSAAFQSDNTLITFKRQLEDSAMMFEMPKGFVETSVIANKQMSYDYAIKHESKQFEVRFAIRPLTNLIKTYQEQEKSKKPGDVNIHPNRFYATSFQATVLNISGGLMPQLRQFPKQAIKSEFNAEWGATTFCEVAKEFGQNYKYCMVVAIHKDDLADAYYFYLSDKQETISQFIEPVFHCLKFK